MGQNHEVHLAINKNDVSSINNVGLSVGGAIYIKKDGNGSTLFQREFINASGPFDIVITDQNETYLTLNYWVAIVLDGDTILKDSSQFAGNSMALIKLKENGDLIFAKTLISSVNSGSPEYSFARNRRMLLNSKNELLITTRDFQGVSFPDTSITCNGSNIGRYPIVFYDTNGNRLRFTILGDCGSLIDLGSISDIIYTDNSEVVIAFSGYLDSARIQNNSFGPVGGVRIVKIDASGNYV